MPGELWLLGASFFLSPITILLALIQNWKIPERRAIIIRTSRWVLLSWIIAIIVLTVFLAAVSK